MSGVAVVTDLDALAERIAEILAPRLLKRLPEIAAEQAKANDRDMSTREAARMARCRPETIGMACQCGKLRSRTTSRTTPSGAPHRLIYNRDLQAWIAAGMPTV